MSFQNSTWKIGLICHANVECYDYPEIQIAHKVWNLLDYCNHSSVSFILSMLRRLERWRPCLYWLPSVSLARAPLNEQKSLPSSHHVPFLLPLSYSSHFKFFLVKKQELWIFKAFFFLISMLESPFSTFSLSISLRCYHLTVQACCTLK